MALKCSTIILFVFISIITKSENKRVIEFIKLRAVEIDRNTEDRVSREEMIMGFSEEEVLIFFRHVVFGGIGKERNIGDEELGVSEAGVGFVARGLLHGELHLVLDGSLIDPALIGLHFHQFLIHLIEVEITRPPF